MYCLYLMLVCIWTERNKDLYCILHIHVYSRYCRISCYTWPLFRIHNFKEKQLRERCGFIFAKLSLCANFFFCKLDIYQSSLSLSLPPCLSVCLSLFLYLSINDYPKRTFDEAVLTCTHNLCFRAKIRQLSKI